MFWNNFFVAENAQAREPWICVMLSGTFCCVFVFIIGSNKSIQAAIALITTIICAIYLYGQALHLLCAQLYVRVCVDATLQLCASGFARR